jgi:hypothetical protein
MMTLMGQMGQPQDYAKGIHMLEIAAQDADENAPQGAYVRLEFSYTTARLLTVCRFLECSKRGSYPR